MWGIENPWKVFNYIYERDFNKNFNFMCIINDKKWGSFTNVNELISLSKFNHNLNITNVKIKNSNNPAKLITFSI